MITALGLDGASNGSSFSNISATSGWGIRLNDRHINMNFDPGFLFPSDWHEALPPGLPLLDSNGASWYNSLQTSLTKRMSKGLQMLVAYFKRT